MENEIKYIDLMDEDGEKVHFEIIETIEIKERKYLIVADEDMEDDDAIVLSMEEDGDEYFFRPVEDEEELEEVNVAYEEILDAE